MQIKTTFQTATQYRAELLADWRKGAHVVLIKHRFGTCGECGCFSNETPCRDCRDQAEENSLKAD